MSHIKALKVYNYYKGNWEAFRHLKQKRHLDILSKTRLNLALAKRHRLIALEKQVFVILVLSSVDVIW